MLKPTRVKTTKDAKLAESFIFEAMQPNGSSISGDPKNYNIPSIKDILAWSSWANLKRPEQPSFIIKDRREIIAGIFGEPVETHFDVGEAEIQHALFKKEYETIDTALALISQIVEFYKGEKAEQTHFWMLESDFSKNMYLPWQKVAVDSFGFGFKGFRRISKWSGEPIVKIEKYF
ncbi:MAG: hypothetical protein PHS44_04875 [Candidatus Dojkabacteria bacterium]|nr:hypothetical protein [Candidatus Dojkabacteria bacterium]